MAKKTDPAKPKHFLRENIEAIGTAIIVALLFKVFILEISRIPSGSMQPTLMGDEQSGLFDRVVVDKLSFQVRDPKRWEIVVFKHPLERSRIMVKRLVGMPGEQFMIDAGDVFTRPDDQTPWSILRRPAEVMDEMWKRVDRSSFGETEWSQIVGKSWRFEPGRVLASGPGKARFRADQGAPLQNAYYDGYPDALREGARGRTKKPEAVGDVRLRGTISAADDATAVVLQIQEGRNAYEFRLPGPAAAADATPAIHTRLDGEEAVTNAAAAWKLAAGDEVEVTATNLDDRVTLEVDGEVLVELDVPGVRDAGAFLAVEFEGGGGRFEDVELHRDIHYLPYVQVRTTAPWKAVIPEGHYVMLGDNTQDSADSRDWTAQRYDLEQDGQVASFRGNFRGQGENPRHGKDAGGRSVLGFRDEWGDVHWFGPQEAVPQLQHHAPLVPRHLVVGRALAVFWPLHKGRLAWLH